MNKKQKKKISDKKRYNKRKNEGICTKCGENQIPDGAINGAYCPQCVLKLGYYTRRHYENNKRNYLERQRKLRDKRRARHQCTHCGYPIEEDWGTIKCPACS